MAQYDPELGVFARVFPAASPKQVAERIRSAGFTVTQLNLSAVGRPTLDDGLTEREARDISSGFREEGVRIWGLSGTFNAIHPDQELRYAETQKCIGLIERAPHLGAEVVTLCTGTRDPDNMWKAHPGNADQPAKDDLLDTLTTLIPAAEQAGIRLGIEPEPGNVISDAHVAEWLIGQLGQQAHALAIVLDPSNLVSVETAAQQESILTHAFDVLGPCTAAVHAKDVVESGYAAPGAGLLDYDLVMRLHRGLPHRVPVIAQDLDADDAPRVHGFLSQHARAVS